MASLSPEEVDPDAVDITVSLQPDGDARWTVAYRMRLQTENETQAFQDLQADVRNNTSAYLDRFRDRITATVAAAENATGREMGASDFAVSTRLQPFGETDYGILTYSFTWSNFARVEGPRLYAGDAISGFYLDQETSLSFTYPDAYGLVSVDPTPSVQRSGLVGWTGPFDFTDDEPRVVVSTAAPTTSAGETTPEPGDGLGGLGPVGYVLVALVAALVVLGAAWYYRGRGGVPGGGPSEEGGEVSEGGGPPSSATKSTEAAESPAAEAGAAAGAGAASEEGDEEPPEELLSNEERVVRFLREHGGRAKQQEIVEGLGWTEAKTSQVLKGMREEGDLEGFRIGRENVIKLPDVDVGAGEAETEDESNGSER
ncbi:helix-turn-helix transcriptional regulator [Halospeciosus flavus]|uniref:helix-turn-helix transcriptional regulator n=1 Tax=Halospeciosus flavus TaxID=3032283 RepID=UPI003617D27A